MPMAHIISCNVLPVLLLSRSSPFLCSYHLCVLLQIQFMSYAFGGLKEYHGKNMWQAHERLIREKGLNDSHFDIIVKHLVESLQKFKVPQVSCSLLQGLPSTVDCTTLLYCGPL